MEEFDISFLYIIDDINLSVHLQARVSLHAEKQFHVHSYRLNEKTIGLLEMTIRKEARNGVVEWVHVDSGLPSSISMAAGKAIEQHCSL